MLCHWSSPLTRGLASAGLCLSRLGCRAQASGCAQGTAEALPGLLAELGSSGFGVQPPSKALVPGVCQHVALPLSGRSLLTSGCMNMVFS